MSDPVSQRCLFCAGPPTMWLRVEWRPDDAFAVPRDTPVCDECYALLTAEQDVELASRMRGAVFDQYGRQPVIQHIRERSR